MASESRFHVTLTGIRPLIIHSDVGLNPQDPRVLKAKSIQSNRKTKDTEESVAEMEWLKYAMSFYGDEDEAVFIPSDNPLKAIIEAGSGQKVGKASAMKEMLAGLSIEEPELPVEYPGLGTPREMFAARGKAGDRPFVLAKSVRIPPGKMGKRVPMSRPRIPVGWKLQFTLVKADFSAMDASMVVKMVETAGRQVGLCDWRPRFGLFDTKVTKV